VPDDQIALSQYDDAVLWSERQADLLRRLAAGERVNAEIDWANVIEEIESVGLSQVHAVQSLLTRAIEHLLKIHGWPGLSADHWRHEATVFLLDANRRWSPAMAQRIALDEVYADALVLIRGQAAQRPPVRAIPSTCLYAFADLIVPRPGSPDIDGLLAKLSVQPPRSSSRL
jgi:hypothetical protein